MTLRSLEQYGTSFQQKAINLLINDKKFLLNVINNIDEEHFVNNSHKWIINEIKQYYEKYHTTLSIEFLNSEVKKIGNEILKLSIIEQINQILDISFNFSDAPWVKEEFFNFCLNQQLKNAITTSVKFLELGDYDGIRNAINNAMKFSLDLDLGHQYLKDIESRYRNDRVPIPFPWEDFNNKTQGGMGQGDLIIPLAPPGAGKTWLLVAIGAHALKLGYNVVHYTLELTEGYMGQRYDACLNNISMDELKYNRDQIEENTKQLKGKLIIKEYAPKRASLNTISTNLKQLKQIENFEPDLIIIDYLDLLKPSRMKKDKKEEIDDVYVEAKGLAKELKRPVISPSQINRAGMNEEIIEGDKVSGSFDKIMIGDIVLSYSRKRKDKLQGTARALFIKNRYGPDGVLFNSTIDTSTGHITMTDTSEDFLEKSNQSNKKDSSGFFEDEKEYLRKILLNE